MQPAPKQPQPDPAWFSSLLERPDYRWLRHWRESRESKPGHERRYESEERDCPDCGRATVVVHIRTVDHYERRIMCRCQLSPEARRRAAQAERQAALSARARQESEAAQRWLANAQASCKEAMLDLGDRCFCSQQSKPECQGCSLRRLANRTPIRQMPGLNEIPSQEVDL